MKGSNVKFGVVNAFEDDYELITEGYVPEKFDLIYPSVLLYGPDKANPTLYEGEYKYNPLSDYILDFCDTNDIKVHEVTEESVKPVKPVKPVKLVKPKMDTAKLNAGPAGMGVLRNLALNALKGQFDIKAKTQHV